MPSHRDTLSALRQSGLWSAGAPLRLHLGCGEQHFDGYVNIDYPPAEHTVQTRSAADLFSDITALRFPDGVVDEVRTHHIFEHFQRPTALALLCRWQRWLKVGGVLWIETPDFQGSLASLASPDYSYAQKQSILRHLFGSHEANWAVHCDGWYREKFEHVLTALGFDALQFEVTEYQRLRNIIVRARKQRAVDPAPLPQAAMALLRESMVDGSPTEERLWRVWCEKFEAAMAQMETGPESSRPVIIQNINLYGVR